MNIEDIELENVERIERQLIEKYGALGASLTNSIKTIKTNLKLYSIDEELLNRVNEEMYEAGQQEDIKDVETKIKHLSSTFWD